MFDKKLISQPKIGSIKKYIMVQNKDGAGVGDNIDISDITSVLTKSKNDVDDIEDILTVSPDLKITLMLLSKLIAMPITVRKPYFNYDMSDLFPPAVRNRILSIVEDYVNHKKIPKDMKAIVNETYTRGSYVRIIVPDKSLVDFIVSNSVVNGKVGTESVINKLYSEKSSILNITDDPTILMVTEKDKKS